MCAYEQNVCVCVWIYDYMRNFVIVSVPRKVRSIFIRCFSRGWTSFWNYVNDDHADTEWPNKLSVNEKFTLQTTHVCTYTKQRNTRGIGLNLLLFILFPWITVLKPEPLQFHQLRLNTFPRRVSVVSKQYVLYSVWQDTAI